MCGWVFCVGGATDSNDWCVRVILGVIVYVFCVVSQDLINTMRILSEWDLRLGMSQILVMIGVFE